MLHLSGVSARHVLQIDRETRQARSWNHPSALPVVCPVPGAPFRVVTPTVSAVIGHCLRFLGDIPLTTVLPGAMHCLWRSSASRREFCLRPPCVRAHARSSELAELSGNRTKPSNERVSAHALCMTRFPCSFNSYTVTTPTRRIS